MSGRLPWSQSGFSAAMRRTRSCTCSSKGGRPCNRRRRCQHLKPQRTSSPQGRSDCTRTYTATPSKSTTSTAQIAVRSGDLRRRAAITASSTRSRTSGDTRGVLRSTAVWSARRCPQGSPVASAFPLARRRMEWTSRSERRTTWAIPRATKGSDTKMGLMSLVVTWTAQGRPLLGSLRQLLSLTSV